MTIIKVQGLNDYSVRVRALAYDYDCKINIDEQDFDLEKDWKFNQILNNILKILTHEENHHSRTEFSQVRMRRGWFRNYLELYNNEFGSEIISPKPTLGYSGISVYWVIQIVIYSFLTLLVSWKFWKRRKINK